MTAPLLSNLGTMADAAGAWLAGVSVQLAVLTLVVVVVDRALAGRACTHWRAAMWWLVMIAPAASLCVSSPISVWRVADPAAQVSEWVWRFDVTPPIEEDPWRLIYPEAAAATMVQKIGRAVVGTWAAGSVGLLVLMAWRSRAVGGAAAWRTRATLPDWLCEMARRAARRMGMTGPPHVVVSEGSFGPAVIGVWRPRVVLPAGLVDGADRSQIEHVLLHEFAHVRRRDALAARLCQWVQIGLWFHPALWLARRQLELLREIECDGLVARTLRDEAPAYRLTLLRLARSLLVRPAAMGFVHTHSQIMARLTHLELPPLRRPGRARAAAACVFGVLLVCCVPRIGPSTRPVEATAEELSKLPGCFQLRFAVMRAQAEEAGR